MLSSIAIGIFCIIALVLIVFGIPQPVKMISGMQQKEQPKVPAILLSPQHHPQYQQQQYIQIDNTNRNNTTKLAILTFGDTIKSQVITAKPILDKYGFKASFFITCDWVGLQPSRTPRLTWQDISLLQKDGQDIESKTMTHRDLSKLSAADLNFEVAQSKRNVCLIMI